MHIAIAPLAVAGLAAVLVGGVAAADSASHGNGRRCAPRHATIEARGRLAIAYKNPRNGGLYACLYASGRARLVVDQFWFPRPAVDINGRLIGSAAAVSDAAENPTMTIVVQELRRNRAPRLRLALVRPPLEVGSLQLKSAGALAWIECSGASNGPGDPRPDCVAPGRSLDNAVVKRDSATDTTTDSQSVDVLATGRSIDPHSLQLRGSRLSWTQAGKRHFAALR